MSDDFEMQTAGAIAALRFALANVYALLLQRGNEDGGQVAAQIARDEMLRQFASGAISDSGIPSDIKEEFTRHGLDHLQIFWDDVQQRLAKSLRESPTKGH